MRFWKCSIAAVDLIDGKREVNIHLAIGKRGCTFCTLAAQFQGYVGNPPIKFDPLPRSATCSTAAVIHLRDQLAALGTIFPVLISVESTPLFYSLLARTTLPTIWTARVVMNRSFTSPDRDLTLPTLPVLHHLEIMVVEHRGFTNPPCPITVLLTASWSTALPQLKRLVCSTPDVMLPALAHPGLREVRLASAVWNQLDSDTVHLPSATRLALTSDDEQNPVLSLAALAGMPRVSHLDLDLDYLTLPVAAALTEIAIANVSCPRDLMLMYDPEGGRLPALRFVYTPTNEQVWSVVCTARNVQLVFWPVLVIVDAVGAGLEVDMARIGKFLTWVDQHRQRQ
ncbi:hypothetical protein GGF32_003583 [Allomyces javanicus]|nr:hypothetical protein GGF32_003583 [Allomyces javanicus]